MDKLKKILQKFSKKEQKNIDEIIDKILNKDIRDLNITKLKGAANIYRAKKGRIRVIYQLQEDDILVIAIKRRSEKTYRNF